MKQKQIQILETVRVELGLSFEKFCNEIGVSRQWYYDRRKTLQDVLDLKTLSQLAVDRVGTPIGEMAVKCIRLIDARFVPCVCQTQVGDNGACPRGHGAAVAVMPALEMEAV